MLVMDMFKNRVSQSIVLGFFAAFLAMHCELAASQTVNSPEHGSAGSQRRNASLGVRVQVMASCRFVSGSIDSAEDLRRWIQAQNNGSLSSRCGATQPLLVSLAPPQASAGAAPGSNRSGSQAATSGGSPYDAQVEGNQVLISF